MERAIPAIPIEPTPPGYRRAKRALDVAVAGLGLVVTGPLMAAIAIALKLDSPGPVIFRQERVGLGGDRFVLLKFRTMRADADQAAHRAYVERLLRGSHPPGGGDPHLADSEGAADERPTWTPIADDPRHTRLGRFLRRTHLDELPQLVNVLRGEMSLVGPRPPIPYEVELYEPWQQRRLSVVPGLTGLWQVRGWGRLTFDEGVALDLEYIRRRSIWLDIRIALKTLGQLLRPRTF